MLCTPELRPKQVVSTVNGNRTLRQHVLPRCPGLLIPSSLRRPTDKPIPVALLRPTPVKPNRKRHMSQNKARRLRRKKRHQQTNISPSTLKIKSSAHTMRDKLSQLLRLKPMAAAQQNQTCRSGTQQLVLASEPSKTNNKSNSGMQVDDDDIQLACELMSTEMFELVEHENSHTSKRITPLQNNFLRRKSHTADS